MNPMKSTLMVMSTAFVIFFFRSSLFCSMCKSSLLPFPYNMFVLADCRICTMLTARRIKKESISITSAIAVALA